ncbi:hypothetical protein D3C80_1627580 [compost metagenome]
MLIQVCEYLAVDFHVGHDQETGTVAFYSIDISHADVGGQFSVAILAGPFVNTACSCSELIAAQGSEIGSFHPR